MLQKIMTATEQTTANGQHATLSCHSWLAEPFNNYKCTQNAQTAVAVVVAVASSLSTPRRPLDRPGPVRPESACRGVAWRPVARRSQRQPTFCALQWMIRHLAVGGKLLRACLLYGTTTARTARAAEANQTSQLTKKPKQQAASLAWNTLQRG